MKKLLTLLVAGLLIVASLFTFTACGNGKTVKPGDTIIVGVTDYAPLDYIDEDTGKWTGFDAELATLVFTSLGYKVTFKEIDWDTKIVTLNAGTIDCIWNGMTVNDKLLENLLLSTVYLKNQQVAVVKVADADSINTVEDLKTLTVAVESGSSAEDAVSEIVEPRKLSNQNAAVLDVYGGGSKVAIVDYALAKTLTSEGSTYYNQLVMKDIGFEVEEFSCAVRKSDSKLLWQINKKIAELTKDGTISALAEKYEISNLLPENFDN